MTNYSIGQCGKGAGSMTEQAKDVIWRALGDSSGTDEVRAAFVLDRLAEAGLVVVRHGGTWRDALDKCPLDELEAAYVRRSQHSS